jgi:hypothetical protein
MAFQVTASIAAWLALASAVASATADLALKYTAFVLVLLLSTAPQVATWDVYILADSLAVSASVAAVAAWMRFATRPTAATAVLATALTGFFMFTRPHVFWVGFLACAVCALWSLRPAKRALKLSVAGVLLLLTTWAAATSVRVNENYRLVSDSTLFEFNFRQVLYKRYLHDPVARKYFREHGMPSVEGLHTPPSPPFFDDYPSMGRFEEQLRRRPEWSAWLEGEARSAFAGYVATHPGRVLSEFHPVASGLLSARPARGWRQIEPLPAHVDRTNPFYRGTFEPLWWTDVAAWLGLSAALWGLAAWRRARVSWPVVVTGALVLVTSAVMLFLNWIGAAQELIRHAVPAPQLTRIGLILMATAFADAFLGATQASVTVEDAQHRRCPVVGQRGRVSHGRREPWRFIRRPFGRLGGRGSEHTAAAPAG